MSEAFYGQPSPRAQVLFCFLSYRAEFVFNAFIRRCMIAFIYIVSSVFQVEYPRTQRVAPLPWLGVHVPRFFPPAGFFRGFRVRLWCIAFLFTLELMYNIIVLIAMLNKLHGGLADQRTHISPSLSVRLSSGGKM